MDSRISAWVARGLMTETSIVGRLNDNVREWYALSDDERAALKRVFGASPGALTEDAFASLLRSEAAGVEVPRAVAHRIYASVAHLGRVPFVDGRTPASLSEDQLALAIAWLLPERHTRLTTGVGMWSPDRMPRDHRRLLFQSLAAANVESEGMDETDEGADEEEDEPSCEMLDVLYTTQPGHPGVSPVPRGDFVPLARRLMHGRGRATPLHELTIPRSEFAALVRVLLALQMVPALTSGGSALDDAAQAITAAFSPDGEVVTWPLFDYVVSTTSPSLFDPLYRLVCQTLMGEAPADLPDPYDYDPTVLNTAHLLSPARAVQLFTILRYSVAAEVLHLRHRSSAPHRHPSSAAIVGMMRDVEESALVLLSGTGSQGICGVFSPQPRLDGDAIQPARYGGVRCSIVRLGPVHDVFTGAEGRPGWTVGDGGVVRLGKEGAGVNLVLRDEGGRLHAELNHRGVLEGRDERGGTYEANPLREDWAVAWEVEEVEIWGESPA